jgi:hypothetical protein
MLPSEKSSGLSSRSQLQSKTKPRRSELRPLSIEEVTQVNLATFREGRNHCRWPREVIERFLAVQV